MTSFKVAIIILNWNGKNDTLACLDSLSALTYPHYEVIVIDNGSSDDFAQMFRRQFSSTPYMHCIALPKNLGFAGGNNVGITFAKERGADLFLLLNNDTIVSQDLIESFIEGFTAHPEAGILGARIYLFEKRDTLDHLGGMWLRKKADVRLIGLRETETQPPPLICTPIDYVCGACMAIKRSVIDAIGMLEARYFLYWEENDFCLYARRAGFLILTCPAAKIWHKVSASVIGGRPHSTYFWWRGRLLWIKRHYPFGEKCSIYLTILFPACIKFLKLGILKLLELALLLLFFPKRDLSKQKQKLQCYRAALTGIRDYFLRRFGPGPSWIYRKNLRVKK